MQSLRPQPHQLGQGCMLTAPVTGGHGRVGEALARAWPLEADCTGSSSASGSSGLPVLPLLPGMEQEENASSILGVVVRIK